MQELWTSAQMRRRNSIPWWQSQGRTNMGKLQRALEQDERRAELTAAFDARKEAWALERDAASRASAAGKAFTNWEKRGGSLAHDIDSHLMAQSRQEIRDNATIRKLNEAKEARNAWESLQNRLRRKEDKRRRWASGSGFGPWIDPNPNRAPFTLTSEPTRWGEWEEGIRKWKKTNYERL